MTNCCITLEYNLVNYFHFFRFISFFSQDSSGKEFNSSPLTEEKEEAVKKAMQGFLLPPSAIPSWAENLEDDDLSALVKEKLNTH